MPNAAIPFTPLVESLPASVPFVGPETLERQAGQVFKARLGANESSFGMSPKATQAAADAASHGAWYGDPENLELRNTLAEKHGVDPAEILVGAGIDAILGNTVRMIASPGTPVVTSLGAYPTFNYHVAGYGAVLQTVPYREDKEDPDAILNAMQEMRAPLGYFANPDNPMGGWYDAEAMSRLISGIPDGSVLVLDEAYIEFAPEGTAPPIDTTNPKLLRMRTFSKAQGMAGLRVGYAIGHRDLITGLNKVRNHFEVNRIAQAAALASLHDTGFSASVIAETARGRAEYTSLANELGLKALPSATNFVAIDMGGDGDRAKAVLDALNDEGIFIRMPGVAPLNRCIRVTVGIAEERALFASALRRIVESQKAA